jgi:hypothetical protein
LRDGCGEYVEAAGIFPARAQAAEFGVKGSRLAASQFSDAAHAKRMQGANGGRADGDKIV